MIGRSGIAYGVYMRDVLAGRHEHHAASHTVQGNQGQGRAELIGDGDHHVFTGKVPCAPQRSPAGKGFRQRKTFGIAYKVRVAAHLPGLQDPVGKAGHVRLQLADIALSIRRQ